MSALEVLLVIITAQEFGPVRHAIAADAAYLTVGRDMTCDVCVPDSGVSRTHGRIEWNNQGTYHLMIDCLMITCDQLPYHSRQSASTWI